MRNYLFCLRIHVTLRIKKHYQEGFLKFNRYYPGGYPSNILGRGEKRGVFFFSYGGHKKYPLQVSEGNILYGQSFQ